MTNATAPKNEKPWDPGGVSGPFAGNRLRLWQRYGLALAITFLALAVRYVIAPAEARAPFITVFPAMALAVLLWGFGPGLVVLVLGGVLSQYLFMSPHWSLDLDQSGILIVATYYAAGFGICLIVNRMHKARAALKAAVEEIVRSEARFRTVFDYAPVGIRLMASDGRLLDANPYLCRNLGYEREELVTKSIREINPPEFAQREETIAAEILAHRRDSFVLEKQCLRKDGTIAWGRVTASAPKVEGVDWYIAITEDVTNQRATMEALRTTSDRLEAALADMSFAKEQAERGDRAKSNFLAAASHDLRQPTQALVLLNDLLLKQLDGHTAASLVQRMGASLKALQTLLDGLLDISRLDARVVEADVRAVVVGPLIVRLVDEYAALADQRGIALRAVPPSTLVRTDPALLERILRNLLDNAIRYTERGKILIGGLRRDGNLRLCVIDSGIGIASDQQEAVFQEFYQVGNTERDRTKGLGLGLAVVRRLAALLGHHLSLRSRPGQGSAFMIDLPLEVAPKPVPAPDIVPTEPALGAKPGLLILVIDDEDLVRESLNVLLSAWGHRVITAEDSDEAVRLVRQDNGCPDLILADYRLRHGRTGVSAAREIHLCCGQVVPTVILTGDTAAERVAEAHRSGFSIVHKPLTADRLRQVIDLAATGDAVTGNRRVDAG